MIRERRNREKLEAYYRHFVEDGVLDPNVHPWVAESWKRSRELDVGTETMDVSHHLPQDEFQERQRRHGDAIEYLAHFSENLRAFFQKYDLSLLLVDRDCVVLKSYSSPYYQRTPGEIEGVHVGVEEVGTSSISLALEHKTIFCLFGPEMWVRECQGGDACSAPVMVNGEVHYIITLVSVDVSEIPLDAVTALLLTMQSALEQHLAESIRSNAEEAILDVAPFAVYHILQGGAVAYANRLGQARLEVIGAKTSAVPNLKDVILNYAHTPIQKGFQGIPSYNEEVTWITRAKTYEDITTVIPLGRNGDQTVKSVAVVSMPIEDLRTLVAHAAGYTAKYSLNSMVGEGAIFATVRDKAARVARNHHHVLIQGESGTGKQRMAHGIHRASQRAGGPLISLRCGDVTAELLEEEIFGAGRASSHPGRLELASGGTLFLDEIEKMPKNIADELAETLLRKKTRRVGEERERNIDVRIIAACDGDLKRIAEKGLFSQKLYGVVSRSVIRVPTLRSRREDIPRLAENLLSELAHQHQMEPKQLLPEAVEELKSYDWPGNIKQLQTVLEQAFFRTQGNEISSGDIDLADDVPDSEWKQDRDAFLRAWKGAGGNVSRLANLLDVSRVTLYRYLKKYGLRRKS